MNLKPYPEYKDSGVEWIGKIPSEWEITTGKIKFKVLGGYAFPSNEFTDKGISLIRIGDITNDTINLDNMKKLPDYYALTKKEFLVNENDILIAMTGATIGKIGQVPEIEEPLLLNQRIGKIETENSNYYKYIFKSDFIQSQIKLIAEGSAQENISSEQIENFKVVNPNENTKNKIVSFLDKKTSEIDLTIEKDTRLIELLKEKRTALINHVVTKGLDPTVKMKDSGVEWIGEIPEDWEVRKIKSFSVVRRGASPRPIDDPKYFDENGEYSWVRISDVTVSSKYLYNTTEKLSVLGKSFSVPLEPGELFISIAGSVGKPIMTKIKCCIHDGFVYFQDLKLDPEYLYYVFIGGQAFQGLGKLGTQLNLNTETIGNIKIPHPSEELQSEITQFLDRKTSEINVTIEKIQDKINLLEEYKKSLIHHVVTGKVDVREVAV